MAFTLAEQMAKLLSVIKADVTAAREEAASALAEAASTAADNLAAHTGSGGDAHAAATDSVAGFMSAADKLKIDGVADAATANAADATLLSRANHTGTQLAETISDFKATAITALLTGLSMAAEDLVESTDTILQGFGKLQARLSATVSNLTAHLADMANPHGVTKAQVDLANVDNTADADKPVSAAQLAALNLKATLDSPNFTTLVRLPNETVFKKASGQEGGQLKLEKPADGSTLAGDIIFDCFGTSARIFEDGGGARGYWLDLTEGLPSASSKLFHQGFKPTKSDVGLSLVDNTADTEKPVSVAQQAALNLKAPLADPFFSGVATILGGDMSATMATNTNAVAGYEVRAKGSGVTLGPALMTFHRPGNYAAFFGIDTDNLLKFGGWSAGGAYAVYHAGYKPTKADVGLANVDNTSDADKPVSTAQQTALNLKATLNAPTFTGGVTSSRLRTARAFDSAQLQAYAEAGSTEDFASIAFHVQDAANAPQMGYDATTGKMGSFDTSGTPLFTWDVATTITGLLKAVAGQVTAAAANTDYLPVNNAVHTGTTSLGSFTVLALPPTPSPNSLAFALDGRKMTEVAGMGTGVPVYFSTGFWRVFSTDAPVTV